MFPIYYLRFLLLKSIIYIDNKLQSYVINVHNCMNFIKCFKRSPLKEYTIEIVIQPPYKTFPLRKMCPTY